ncbi:hypothetical protein FQN50_007066 [Emmonsiellopsis sp. PD_5]|nr:hypothetical protein FQN50_007066 [Emmonsiellopsis sp. PD_5]
MSTSTQSTTAPTAFLVSTHRSGLLKETDSHIIVSRERDKFLDTITHIGAREGFPRSYEVVEAIVDSDGSQDEGAICNVLEVPETELIQWLDTVSKTPRSPDLSTRARFLLGPTGTSRYSYTSPWYPDNDSYQKIDMPFSKAGHLAILDKFNLPMALTSDAAILWPHFQKYTLRPRVKTEENCIGFTMCIGSYGFLDINACISISYNPIKGTVNAFLHGCTSDQQKALKEELNRLSILSGHPLLLPMIIILMSLDVIQAKVNGQWTQLLEVETRSGQTGAPAVHTGSNVEKVDVKDFDKVTREVLGVIQYTTDAQCHVEQLLVTIEEIQKCVGVVRDAAKAAKSDHAIGYIEKCSLMISEALDFCCHTTKVVLSSIKSVEQRAQAQQSAIYSYIGQQEALEQRKQALSTGHIAIASKRDSSAMKGIAVLTMFFLPGTFFATFFSMPVMDFSIDDGHAPASRKFFWLYWAISVPVTIVVFMVYGAFRFYTDRRHRREDRLVDVEADVTKTW